jgi:pyruvate,orthophosphate dikinase
MKAEMEMKKVSVPVAADLIRSLVRRIQAGDLTKEQAILQLNEPTIELLTKSSFDSESSSTITSGVPVSSGVATGRVCFSVEKCLALSQASQPTILLADSIRAEDINGFPHLQGVLSLTEDPTSHASIIARVMEKPFVSMLRNAAWAPAKQSIRLGSERVIEGDWLSLNGFDGDVFKGKKTIRKPMPPAEFNQLSAWIGESGKLSVHGNADTPEEAQSALENGASAIEPRTEYMFFKPRRLRMFRRMILARTEAHRARVLAELMQAQRDDFIRLFEVMGSLPVHIRLLDPPLHEFLPKDVVAKTQLAEDLQVAIEWVEEQIAVLEEINPMMGHRGARLLITRPTLTEMQARAIFEAALEMHRRGVEVKPIIVIPMVVDCREVVFLKRIIARIHLNYLQASGIDLQYAMGAMIETPRAALVSDKIASEVEFLSFGTNDLTAQTFGFSRGDVLKKFLSKYLDQGILDFDPFYSLDESVVFLIRETVRKARVANPRISIGLCGEQGGERNTIKLCHEIGLNSISCSPGRIPVAKLYAAQAAIETA